MPREEGYKGDGYPAKDGVHAISSAKPACRYLCTRTVLRWRTVDVRLLLTVAPLVIAAGCTLAVTYAALT